MKSLIEEMIYSGDTDKGILDSCMELYYKDENQPWDTTSLYLNNAYRLHGIWMVLPHIDGLTQRGFAPFSRDMIIEEMNNE